MFQGLGDPPPLTSHLCIPLLLNHKSNETDNNNNKIETLENAVDGRKLIRSVVALICG